MSNISDSYDAIVSRVQTLLPSHTRLSSAYSIDENTEPALTLGWAIQIQSGENSKRQLQCDLSIRRSVVIIITRKFYARELDITSKASTEKQLFEDQLLVIKDLEKDPTVNAPSYIAKFEYVGDSGIQTVFSNKDQFLKLETIFTLEYFESLT